MKTDNTSLKMSIELSFIMQWTYRITGRVKYSEELKARVTEL